MEDCLPMNSLELDVRSSSKLAWKSKRDDSLSEEKKRRGAGMVLMDVMSKMVVEVDERSMGLRIEKPEDISLHRVYERKRHER